MTRFLRIRKADGSGWLVKGRWSSAPNSPDVVVDDSVTGTGLYRHNFTGTWPVGQNASAIGGTDRYTNVTGSKLTFTFNGSRIEFFGPMAPNHGIIEASVDGGASVDWDTYSATRLDGQRIGAIAGLSDAQHTIVLNCSGRRNAASSGFYIGVDWAAGPFVDYVAPTEPEVVTPPPSSGTISHLLLPGKRPTGPNANDGNPFATPLGANAVMVPAGLGFAGAASGDKITTDSIRMGMDATAPLKDIFTATTANNPPAAVTPNYNFPAGTKVRVPSTLTSSGGWNSCGALLSDDGVSVWQGQTLYLSAGGNPSWPYTVPKAKVDLRGTSPAGSHGGSALSAAMGTVRAWEWLDDAVAIQHALVINLYADKYLRGTPQGETVFHRWPATVADGYASRVYGTKGSPPAGMKMGALLGLLPTFNLATVTHPKANKIATALKGFGGYVADDTAWDVHAISVESTISNDWYAQSADFHSQLQTVFQALHLVTDNGPTNIGGAGEFRVPPPPALAAT